MRDIVPYRKIGLTGGIEMYQDRKRVPFIAAGIGGCLAVILTILGVIHWDKQMEKHWDLNESDWRYGLE